MIQSETSALYLLLYCGFCRFFCLMSPFTMLLIANTLFCIQSALSFAINVSFRAVFIRFAVSLVIQVNFGVVATDSMLSLSIILESSKMNVSFVHSGQFSAFSFLIYSDRFVQCNWETREMNVTNWLSPPRPRRECHSIRLGKLVSHIRCLNYFAGVIRSLNLIEIHTQWVLIISLQSP